MTSCFHHWSCHSSDIHGAQCHTLSRKIPRYFSRFILSFNNLDSVVTDSVLYLFHPSREVTFLLRGANFPNDQMTSLPSTQWSLFLFLLCRLNKQRIVITITWKDKIQFDYESQSSKDSIKLINIVYLITNSKPQPLRGHIRGDNRLPGFDTWLSNLLSQFLSI